MSATERTPLITHPDTPAPPPLNAHAAIPLPSQLDQSTHSFLSSFGRLVIVAFLIQIAWDFTASTTTVQFQKMVCETYYLTNPPYSGPPSLQCTLPTIQALVAHEISAQITLITVFGVLNLCAVSWMRARWGLHRTMMAQLFFPAVRSLVQQWAVLHGYQLGMRVIQCSQIITILGGGSGLLLCLNEYTALLRAPEQRSQGFGIIQGAGLLGSAVSFTLGGWTGNTFGAIWAYRVSFTLMLSSVALVAFFLPSTPALGSQEKVAGATAGKEKKGGMLAFTACLKVFLPRSKMDGGRKSDWSLTWMGLGIYLGVVAFGFVGPMLQLYGMNKYQMDATQNGLVLSIGSLARGFFLTLAFPRIITAGRKLYSRPSTTSASLSPNTTFDLTFVRLSMLLDGLLTGSIGLFCRSPRDLYLIAAILPFASGTAAAAKGVVMDLVPVEERKYALQAVSLVEVIGQVSTNAGFGWVFAQLADRGEEEGVFVLNAVVAFVATGVLLVVRFPVKQAVELV